MGGRLTPERQVQLRTETLEAYVARVVEQFRQVTARAVKRLTAQRAAQLPALKARAKADWQSRQVRLVSEMERSRGYSNAYWARCMERDPEGTRERRRDAARRSAARKRELQLLTRSRLGAALDAAKALNAAEKAAQREADKARSAAERDAKRASRAEGYPKRQTQPASPTELKTHLGVALQHHLSRLWSSPTSDAPARPDG